MPTANLNSSESIEFRPSLTVTEIEGELSDALQEPQQLAVHRFVAAADGAGLEKIGLAIGAADEAACLADQQRARGDVPVIETAFPAGVEAARGDIGEIERGAAYAAHVDN